MHGFRGGEGTGDQDPLSSLGYGFCNGVFFGPASRSEAGPPLRYLIDPCMRSVPFLLTYRNQVTTGFIVLSTDIHKDHQEV